MAHTKNPRGNVSRIDTFSRDGKSIARIGRVVFSFEQEEVKYLSADFGAVRRDALAYGRKFSRNLELDAEYVSLQIANSLLYASRLGIYNPQEAIKNIKVYIGELGTWRKSVYGSEISTVAAFVYRGSLHIRPKSIDSWNIIQHETGHIVQLHNRREMGLNSYPVPEIREGSAEMFRMAYGTKDIRSKKLRAGEVLKKYSDRHGKSVNVFEIASYGQMILHNSRQEWLKGMECHAAGAIIGLATLWVNGFDVEKTVRDMFIASDTQELTLLLRK